MGYVLLFIAGTFLGSFLNLVSDRLPKDEPILFGRSKCDFCKKILGIKNLVPVFSYLFQKGKCSFCGRKLTYIYPISEAMSGMLVVLSAYLSGIFKNQSPGSIYAFIFYLVILSIYLIIFLTDLKECIIPDIVVIPGIIFSTLSLIIARFMDLFFWYRRLSSDVFGSYLIKSGYFNRQVVWALKDFGYIIAGAVILGLFFYFLVYITKGRGMGRGDIKLGFMIGIVNGFPFGIIAVFLGFVIGALYSLVLIILKKKGLKDTIPFGPFLITGSIITLIYGSNLLNWYIHLF